MTLCSVLSFATMNEHQAQSDMQTRKENI